MVEHDEALYIYVLRGCTGVGRWVYMCGGDCLLAIHEMYNNNGLRWSESGSGTVLPLLNGRASGEGSLGVI